MMNDLFTTTVQWSCLHLFVGFMSYFEGLIWPMTFFMLIEIATSIL